MEDKLFTMQLTKEQVEWVINRDDILEKIERLEDSIRASDEFLDTNPWIEQKFAFWEKSEKICE
ncbi:hypothetical protein MO973_19580 [Paenibacillus sp. TRM 82003]|nr:hypothetical protein [Paenibacillus sp. TRM 82003]